MEIGNVIYDSDFEFPNGGHADKLLIVLSTPDAESIVLLIVTSKGSAKDLGCQARNRKYFFRNGQFGFEKDTWVDLDRNVTIRETTKLQERIDSGKATVLFSLPEHIVNAIRNCQTKHAIDSLSREACDLLGVQPKW